MDKEDVVHVYSGILLNQQKEWRKKIEIMPFIAIWMGLEMIILNEVRQRQISYDITYMGNLKDDSNELIYKPETDSLS